MASKFLPLWQNGKHKSRLQQKSCGPFFSIFCLCVGIIGFSFGIFTLIRGRPVHKFRCGNAEDTLRSLHLGGTKARYSGWPGGVSQLEEETRHKVLGVVGIQTGFASSERRKALRDTWLPSDPDGLISLEQATGLAFRFVIGRSKDVQEMAELEKEIEKYKDFMLIDIEEEYLKLPYKTLAFFKAAYALFDADFYVKADDDIYLRPDRLATLLAKERPSPRTYIGCMKKGPVITDPKLKWYEPLGYLLGGEYFYHAYGPIYALSSEVVAGLAVARNDSFRMFSNEDVTIGAWMLAMNVNHEDNRAICDSRCKPKSIAVWDIPKCSGLCNPVEKLRQLHKIDMCSKSPTLPPPHMAKQILKSHDQVFASRPVMGDNSDMLSPQKVAFAPYGPYWKFMRKILVRELFSPTRMKSFASLRAQEVLAMTRSILQTAATNASVVDVTREVTFFTNNIVSRMSFGKICSEAELGGKLFREVMDEAIALSGGFNYRDYIPLLGRLDLQGHKRRHTELTKIFHVFLERIVDERLQKRGNSSNLECEDFVDVLLSLSEDVSMEIKITPDHIKNVILDLLIAGTDTSGATLEWGMSELLRNPSVMKRAQEELDSVVGQSRMVKESDLPHLQYLQSVVKETLRLYPSAPLLLPHESMEHSTIGGYQIPEKTGVLVNAWAIGRDPIAWEEANAFKPERFLGSQIDVKGHNFELIPFGSGRRGCPGIQLALPMIQLGFAQLLHCFNWYLSKGVTPETLDLSEVFGFTMPRAVHLLAIPIPRLQLNLYEPSSVSSVSVSVTQKDEYNN